MGADIVEQAVPSFERKWDRGFLALCERGLFSKDPEFSRRRFPANSIGHATLEEGHDYCGHLHGASLVVVRNGTAIAEVVLPIQEQNRIRNEGFGSAVVRVESATRPISGVADVSLR